jgi:hypothetical protein
MSRALPLMIAILVAGGAARAQEAIATAKGAPPPAPPAAAPLTLGGHDDFDDEGPVPVGPCGAVGHVKDGVMQPPDKRPHGEVFGGVGTHGYREAGGVVCLPVGDHSAVTLAVDVGRIGR